MTLEPLQVNFVYYD